MMARFLGIGEGGPSIQPMSTGTDCTGSSGGPAGGSTDVAPAFADG